MLFATFVNNATIWYTKNDHCLEPRIRFPCQLRLPSGHVQTRPRTRATPEHAIFDNKVCHGRCFVGRLSGDVRKCQEMAGRWPGEELRKYRADRLQEVVHVAAASGSVTDASATSELRAKVKKQKTEAAKPRRLQEVEMRGSERSKIRSASRHDYCHINHGDSRWEFICNSKPSDILSSNRR